MKKFKIGVSTNWCGMDATHYAYANISEELEEIAQQLAYENFESYGGIQLILEGYFDVDGDGEYSDEDIVEANESEGECYDYFIEEIQPDTDEEEYFDDAEELIYDGRLEELRLTDKEKITIYNNFLISFHTCAWTGHVLSSFFDKMAAYSYTRTNSIEGESCDEREIAELLTLHNLVK